MPRGLGLLIYGTEGVGKTSFALQFPKPLKCLSINEAGFIDLADVGEIPEGAKNVEITSWPQLRSQLKTDCPEKTIVIDSGSGLQQLLFEHVTEAVYEGDTESFLSYYKGPRMHCPQQASELTMLFENLRAKEKNVLFLVHDTTEKVQNPRGIDYDTVDLEMDKGIRDVFKKWAQCILFMGLDPNIARITKSDKTRSPIEGKMQDDDIRIMFTTKSLVHSAKNKLHLPPVIPLGSSAPEAYKNFVSKLPPNFKEVLSG